MQRFKWTDEGSGTESLEIRVIRRPDGQVTVTNLNDEDQEETYRTHEECRDAFSDMLSKS